MEKGSLGKSRKFMKGSVHENATGRFTVLDRYMGDDDKPWLKFQWISGDKNGIVEDNKEENVNASLYKYKVTRGIKDNTELHPDEIITLNQVFQVLEENNGILKFYEEDRERVTTKIIEQQETIIELQMKIEKLTNLIEACQRQIDNVLNQTNLVNKLVDKIPTV